MREETVPEYTRRKERYEVERTATLATLRRLT